MKITVCDICKAEPAEPIRLLNGHTESGPDGVENCYEYFELCLKHMAYCVSELCRLSTVKATQEQVCVYLKNKIRM